MKKYFMLLFVYSNILLFAQNSPFDGNGDGSIGNPYQLWTKAHLEELADSINNSWVPNFSTWHFDKHFKLMDDINDPLTESIGKYAFRGHFHGQGKKITLAINCDYYTNQSYALFNGLDNGNIDSLILDGYVNYGLAGITTSVARYSEISYCVNNVTIIQNVGKAGGIAYSNSGTIINCINNGDITGVNIVGGIVGDNEGTIINCINTGNVTATNSGSNTNLVGEMTPNNGVGGIVGCVSNYCQGISNCINIGTIKGQDVVGGINGGLNRTSITNCINAGYVAGWAGVGGIGGVIFNFYGMSGISNSVNVGVVEGEEDIGSIVGKE
ncbi:MAG: hypothetical protein FWG85_06460 [Bacteroidetes bacterium]|nr:hypothetical protein [Bacteroidota bacterium]